MVAKIFEILTATFFLFICIVFYELVILEDDEEDTDE